SWSAAVLSFRDWNSGAMPPFVAARSQAATFSLSIFKSIGAVLTRCRMTKYKMNPKPHKKKATVANTTTGLKAMPSKREPFDWSFEQSIAAHNAVNNPNKRLAPTVNKPMRRKLTINHATAGTTTCGGQPYRAVNLALVCRIVERSIP